MDQYLDKIIGAVLEQGFCASLYIYLFFQLLRQNEQREENYLGIITRLNDSINNHLDKLNESIKRVEKLHNDADSTIDQNAM